MEEQNNNEQKSNLQKQKEAVSLTKINELREIISSIYNTPQPILLDVINNTLSMDMMVSKDPVDNCMFLLLSSIALNKKNNFGIKVVENILKIKDDTGNVNDLYNSKISDLIN